jgi:photosystem II stability/assembly factor-like uncharacterized protein
MSEHDDRLSDELQDYYSQMTQQPAPDVLGRVMASTDRRAARMRRWGAIGGGALAVAAVAGVIVLAFANHGTPSGVAPGHSSTPGPTVGPTSTPTAPTNTVVPTQPVPVGPAVHGFVPTDVTAISADQWWVLGYDVPTCSSASCTRILHTDDGGHTFASIPVPSVAPAQGSEQAVRLRFADGANGWVVGATGVVWATHDGGAHWTADSNAGSVSDLEASGGAVYAVACVGGQSCTVERSAAGQDGWSALPASAGHGQLNHLTVNGSHLWVAIDSSAGGLGWVLASPDRGQHFSMQTVCPSELGFASVYAVSSSVLWATCVTGTEAAAFQSVDGGQQFTQLPGPVMLANFASIAGVSSTTAVIGAQALLRTTDGGQSFTTVESNQSHWTIVGFTTSVNGFAFAVTGSDHSQLWRTNDAGAQWYVVQFP